MKKVVKLLTFIEHPRIHVSLYKAFKSHKNVAGSMFSKGIGVHSHLITLCRKSHFSLHSFLEVPLVTTKTALR